jgi:hypothetical protein
VREHALHLGQSDRQAALEQPRDVACGVRDALQKTRFALEEAAVAVRAHRLHDANQHKTAIGLDEPRRVDFDEPRQSGDVLVEQVLAYGIGISALAS